MILATLAAAALLMAPQQTDTVFPLGGATRLRLDNPGGAVVVRAWDRNDVRIQASHSSRAFVRVRRSGEVLRIDADARRGPAVIVDYEIQVPATLDLDLQGFYANITVEGTRGEVNAETTQGNIEIRGGRGRVKASSTTGTVRATGSEGRVELETVAREIRVTGASGEIFAESVGGSIHMEGITARTVEAGTVGGRIHFDGTVQDGGRYLFGTHGGSITVVLPAGINATVNLATLHGRMRLDYPGAPSRVQRGQRQTFTVGTGSALVEVESFAGSIELRSRGSGAPGDAGRGAAEPAGSAGAAEGWAPAARPTPSLTTPATFRAPATSR